MINTTHYTITGERLPIHELIGLNVRVISTRDAGKKEIAGKIVDETQRMIVIETQTGEKNVPKNETTFAFELGEEIIQLEGSALLASPVERLKKGGRAYVN